MYELKDYLNAINHTKEKLMDTEDETWEKKYPPFVINKCLHAFQDTILFVNEINQLPNLDNKLQFDFFLNTLRARKRYTALDILDDEQISAIKQKLYKGGRDGRN